MYGKVTQLGALALLLAIGAGCESGTSTTQQDAELPPVLQDAQIAELLTAPPAAPRGGTAEADLQRAREAYALMRTRPESLYRCVYYYRRATARGNAAALAGDDTRKYEAAKSALITKVTPLYRQAASATQRQQWPEAKGKFLQLCRMLPVTQGESSEVRTNVQAHLTFIAKAQASTADG